MNNIAVGQLIDVLTNIKGSSEKDEYYKVVNPLSIANAFIEIIIRSIYNTKSTSSRCILEFKSKQQDMDDGKIIIKAGRDTLNGDKENIIVESSSDYIDRLTQSTIDICIDIIRMEYRYCARYDDNNKNIIVIEW